MIYPSREEFSKLAQQGNLIPVFSEVIADMETPVSAYYKINKNPDSNLLSKYSFLLESVEGGENIARYSFICSDLHSLFIQSKGVAKLISDFEEEIIEGKDIFDKLNNVLKRYNPVEIKDLPPNIGGAVGYASYDVVSEIEKSVIAPSMEAIEDVPEAVFMITDSFLVFDKVKHTIKVISQAYLDKNSNIDEVYDSAVNKINNIIKKLKTSITVPPVKIPEKIETLEFSSNKTKTEYCDMVEKTKQYIMDGDIIQAVISQRFSIESKTNPLALYRSMRIVNPSPYMFLLNCKDFAVVGASPEVNVKCIDRKINVRPIAGTRKRGIDFAEDSKLEKELLDDPKEKAEHIMLVDLGRNDIGRIAKSGTVEVDQLMIVEKYSHVMHIVSDVVGILDEKYESDSVMRSTFPAGTLSGAPKVRAMQIISEQEKEKRGPYGGTVAYYSFNGNVDSCITIRTAVIKDDKVYIQAGGGIVADSVPETEYEETLNKAKAAMRAVSMSESFKID